MVAKICYAFTVLMTYPVSVFPCYEILDELLGFTD